jgi:hypothetical protein
MLCHKVITPDADIHISKKHHDANVMAVRAVGSSYRNFPDEDPCEVDHSKRSKFNPQQLPRYQVFILRKFVFHFFPKFKKKLLLYTPINPKVANIGDIIS